MAVQYIINNKAGIVMIKSKLGIGRAQVLGLVTGVIIAYAITAVIFIGTAIGITYTNLQETTVPIIVMITCVISVMVAGFDASRRADNKGWVWGMAAGFLYAIVLICIIVWVSGGFVMDGRKVMLTLLSLIGGGIGGVIGINFRK